MNLSNPHKNSDDLIKPAPKKGFFQNLQDNIKEKIEKFRKKPKTIVADSAKNKGIIKIYSGLLRSYESVGINIFFIVLALSVFPNLFSNAVSGLLISLVYVATMLHGIYTALKFVLENRDFFIKHKCSIKGYMKEKFEAEIRKDLKEVADSDWLVDRLVKFYFSIDSKLHKSEIVNANPGVIKPISYRLWSFFFPSQYPISSEAFKPAAETIAEEAISIMLFEIKTQMQISLLFFLHYWIVARFIVVPVLINNTTHLSMFETLVFPFVFLVNNLPS